MCAWLPYKETTRRAEVPERARARPGHARNVLAVSTHCQMPSSSSFSVKPQPAQENQNPHGYSTQPAFFMPGSKAAGAQSRRKKKTLAPLAPLAEANQMMEGCSYSFGSNNYGLMTPETPSTNFLVTNMNYGQQHTVRVMYFLAGSSSRMFIAIGKVLPLPVPADTREFLPRRSAKIARSCIFLGTWVPAVTLQQISEARRQIMRSGSWSSAIYS